nr:MAG TPA: hypothetical protein [Caudoviricetes sp.]
MPAFLRKRYFTHLMCLRMENPGEKRRFPHGAIQR